MTRPPGLGPRTPAVFDAFTAGRGDTLHPDDLAEASAFWTWLGERERPVLVEEAPPRARAWPHIAAAAAAVLAIGSTLTWTLRAEPDARFTERYATGHAQRGVVHLADGSTVTLAPDSRVAVAYTAGARRLRLLQGEALFDVAHNKARPFIVQTPHGEVKAVGTAFDVALGSKEADVTVVEGTVRIALAGGDGGSEPIVKLARKGEKVAFGVAARPGGSVGFISQSAAADIDDATAWTRGQLVFHGEPLEQVLEAVNRYATDRVELIDPRAARLPVYGVVNQGDTAAIRDLVEHPNAIAIQRGAK